MDDVVVISALRTPMCKVFLKPSTSVKCLCFCKRVHTACCVLQAKRGALKDCPADDMLAAVLQATVDRTGVEPEVFVTLSCCYPRIQS